MIVRSQRMKLDQIDYLRFFALRTLLRRKKERSRERPTESGICSVFLWYKRRYLHLEKLNGTLSNRTYFWRKIFDIQLHTLRLMPNLSFDLFRRSVPIASTDIP